MAKAHKYEATAQRTTFADVAGIDEAKDELAEVVDYLRHPDRYRRLGTGIPHGVLLSGQPGTGKTLLARAVAGEASVPFYSISASEFVEMVVGVGASRVRDLFEQAKADAPSITRLAPGLLQRARADSTRRCPADRPLPGRARTHRLPRVGARAAGDAPTRRGPGAEDLDHPPRTGARRDLPRAP